MSESMAGGRPSDVGGLRSAFSTDSWRGRLAILTAFIVLIAPSLAAFVSTMFLALLAVALILSFASLAGAGAGPQGRTGPSRLLARAGYAMVFNGALLIVGLFVTGLLGDFLLESREGLVHSSVALGFTTVHILLGIGLLLVDDHRHAVRADI